MHTTGGCFCGAIEYRAEIDEERIGICHCRDCQIFSGSAFRTAAIVEPARFAITKGEPRIFAKTAASGRVRDLLFCGECGTHLCSRSNDAEPKSGYVSLRVATSVDFPSLRPAGELWCASRVAWLPELEGTVKSDGQP